MTLIGEKYQQAVNNKNNNLNSFIWKGSKSLDEKGRYVQSEKRLIDMNEYELNVCYDHCKTMLYNNNSKNPGRYVVLELITDQQNKINAELFKRWMQSNHEKDAITLRNLISEFFELNKELFKTVTPLVEMMYSGIPTQFNKVPLSLVLDSCLDRLGTFDKKHITRTFILKQGIWLTPTESKDLIEVNPDGSTRERLEVIKERLNVKKDVEKLFINSKGLNFTEMRAMLGIKPNKKYSELTTSQLEILQKRMLYSLEESVNVHIKAWEDRMIQIEKVAEFKGFKL